MLRFESIHGFDLVGNLYEIMHFAGSNLSRDPKCPKIFAFSRPNHAEGVYGIKAKPCMESTTCCGMNHHAVMHGINPKEDTR